MRNKFKAIVVGLILSVVTATVAQAMSELASISLTPLWPTSSNPGNSVRYLVTVERIGQGNLELQFSCVGLPEGSVASFGDAPVRFKGQNPQFAYFILTITSAQPTAIDSCAFTLTGTAQHEAMTVANTPFTVMSLGMTGPSMAGLDLLPGGDVELRGVGKSGQTYQIEATTDLANPAWSTTGSCTADGNGRFTFDHVGAKAKESPMRFYRAVEIAAVTP